MNEEKRFGGASANRSSEETEDKQKSTTSSRARNRTVMLTPEMTGQVRKMLYQEPEEEAGGSHNPLTDLLPPLDWSQTEDGKAEAGYDNGSNSLGGAQEDSGDFGKDLAAEPKAGRSGSTSRIDPPKLDPLESKPEPAVSHPPFGGGADLRGGEMRGGEMRGGEPRGGPGEPRPGLGSARAEIPSRGDSPRAKGTTGLFAMGAGGPTPVGGMMGGAGAPGSGTVSGRGMQVPVGAQVKTQVNPNVSFRVNAPAEQAKTATVPAVPVQKAPASKVVGFLVSYDKDAHGEVYEVRAGRWLLTSRPTDHGDYILVNDESISPLHAIVRATKEGKIQVLDQLSEFGTGVIRAGAEQEEEVAGAMVGVDHGDSIRFGERFFVVVTIPKGRKTPQAGGE